ncbi:response regulator [Paraferrimonas sedimenticola]|uniref:DNA-binding response regulator n=1 Tax=Paraferrimonas sedimenticola TaxID=375674 RepID=A0AA37W042_9GAMM|nr:response regulator [Paraferrimonas sedimenticola]GLP97599.1 DNA-binding response regulator [Paraferrimonas sedimenticola]
MSHLLLVDDDAGLSELLAELLQLEGYQLTLAADGPSGLAQAMEQDFDVILLDVMLPGLNGFEVLKALRESKQTPVLMLTAKGDPIDKVLGLEIGADDYLAKPFNEHELLARIKALLRRAKLTQADADTSQSIKEHDIELFPGRQEAHCNEHLLELTSTEFAILAQLIDSKGELVTKETLSLEVLGKRLAPFDRSIDMHLSNLRKKLPERDDGRPRIKTLRGKGYLWLV